MEKCNFSSLLSGDEDLSTFSRRPSITDTDAILAKELHELSLKQRERVFEEIHGVVGSYFNEDPTNLTLRFSELDEEIKKIKKKPEYERALFLSPRYVRDADFRLNFLRADGFDTSKAAQRMVNYFQHKMELFGEEKLVKKISLDDLDEDDIAELSTGSFQFLPQKDRSGRPICFVIQKLFNYKSWQSKLRNVWYWIMTTLEDQDASRNGFVNVFYNPDMGSTEKLYLDLVKKVRIINDSLPYRNIASHYCYNDPRLRPAIYLFQTVMGKDNRLRFRTHFGSHMECQYMLMTFGIQKELLPVDELGNPRHSFTENFFERRKAIEQAARSQQASDIIDFPSKRDILLGRGKPYQAYSGNVMLSHLVDSRRDEYNRASRFEKTCIAMGTVKVVKEYNGRFLQRDESSGGWVEVEDHIAREKTSRGFRTRARRQDFNDSSTMKGGGSRVYCNEDETESQPRQKRPKVVSTFQFYL